MQIHEQNSSLARESKVLEVGLDQVYSFSSGASKQGTEGLTFRFMPDAEEVQQALQVEPPLLTALHPLVRHGHRAAAVTADARCLHCLSLTHGLCTHQGDDGCTLLLQSPSMHSMHHACYRSMP